jgi:signal transduction histidine kinase
MENKSDSLNREDIQKLKDFVSSYYIRQEFPEGITFEDGDLIDIQLMIINICNQLESNKKEIQREKEKLIAHFHYEEEGISFFTPTFENIYSNSHFIQFLNILLDKPTYNVFDLFQAPVFGKFVQFLNNPDGNSSCEDKIHINGYYFFIQFIIFEDKSFEVIIRDISEMEKENIHKTEITNNIAHELRTPLTSIRGYLETLLHHKTISVEKKYDYLERAYFQTVRLSEIIQDIVLLSKTADTPTYFTKEDINLYDFLTEMLNDTQEIIAISHSKVELRMSSDIVLSANRTLLYSIFWNLLSNAIKYSGENPEITIYNYMEDTDYYYFSFSDNGKGIDEKYLDRIFQRFYRISEGGTQDKRGAGLGLTIVRDAVKFHHGEIHAKNKHDGGLEFLFTLRKK